MSSIIQNDYWTHDLSPFVFKFSENFGIRYYGLAYVLGFLTAAWLLKRYYQKGLSPYNPEQQSNLFIALIAGVVIGGRLGYFLFYTPELILSQPLSLFYLWEGGMASHGGFIGVAAATWLMARKCKYPFWTTADLVVSLAPAGLLFGRIANFINGELWGKPTAVAWAVIFPDAPDEAPTPRHPSQLYEATLEGLVMLLYTQYRIWRSPALKEHPGSLTGEFLLGYSILRIIGEQFREPDAALTFGLLSRGATLSLLMAVAGAWIIWRAQGAKGEGLKVKV